jgi:hypothetical protein
VDFAGFVNGVAKLHGLVSQKLLHPFWPGLLENEVPVTSPMIEGNVRTWAPRTSHSCSCRSTR